MRVRWLVRWLGPSLVVALAIATSGCDPKRSTILPTRAGKKETPAGLGIPYPVSEPETTEGWSRAALSRSAFGVVFTQSEGGVFPRRVRGPEPVLLGSLVPESAEGYEPLLRIAFDGKTPTAEASTTVTREALAKIGVRRPAGSVFVVGNDDNCRALVNAPRVHWYVADEPVLQVDWTLTGCDWTRAWGPIGVIADQFPEDTTWVAAELPVDATYDAGGWDSPLAARVQQPQWSGDTPAELEVVRVLEIPGSSPRAVQVYDSLVLPADEAEHERLASQGLDPACADAHSTVMMHGFWNGAIFDAFDPGQPDDEPHLVGALVRGSQVDALVYDLRLSALVVVPPAPALDGSDDPDEADATTKWTRRSLPTAVHSDYAPRLVGLLAYLRPHRRRGPLRAAVGPTIAGRTG